MSLVGAKLELIDEDWKIGQIRQFLWSVIPSLATKLNQVDGATVLWHKMVPVGR